MLILVESALINTSPMTPPITPPVTCKTAKRDTPSNIVRFIKRIPIMVPATAVEIADTTSRLIILNIGFSRQLLYPISLAKTSKTMLAVVKPKKWMAEGLSAKVMIVAIMPVRVTAPNFLTCHNTKINEMTPSVSHKKGRWVALQKMGVIYALKTLHRAADNAIEAMSRLVR
jgi:hypothetical protein